MFRKSYFFINYFYGEIMQKTCGVAVITKDMLVLIGRATNSNNWSIPKGLNDLERLETDAEASRRELKEETGIEISIEKLKYAGHKTYKNNKKQLEMFYCFVDNIDLKDIKCDSYFEHKGKILPEICEFKLIPLCDINQYNIHDTQKYLLNNLIKNISL